MFEYCSDPHSRSLRTGRLSSPYACYSITKNVEGRRKLLTSDGIPKVLFESWNYLRQQNAIKILAFCIMPDHYHLLFCLVSESQLSDVMESTNKFTAREINKRLRLCGRFWQNIFHDHKCRNEEEIDSLATYIEHNPVRAGLVEFAEDWPYSSAYIDSTWLLDRNWYAQAR